MGLGKTLQAIAAAYYYKDDWPLLVVVPASLRYPWIEEFEKWLPHIHPHQINLVQSCSDVGDISTSLVTIVTYGLLRQPSSQILREALFNQNFKVVIVDESHYMKNRKSATTKYLLPLLQGIDRKLLLSGTPALSRPEELFPQLDAILPSVFGNWSAFANKYCDAHVQFFGRRRQWVTSGASNLEELQFTLSSKLMIRRLKKDVLTQLPPKQRQRIPFEIKESALKKDLDSKWDSLNNTLGRKGTTVSKVLAGGAPAATDIGTNSSLWEIRKGIFALHQDTCHVKLGPVRDYVKMLCQNEGLKFIVFAHHHVMLNSVAEQLHEDKVKYIRIDGNTLQQDRPKLIQQFQVDPNTRVAVLSIQAAGVGLTLTAATLVVFAELDWTPGKMEQAEDRAHRIGQQNTVHVHYLVAKGTLDEWFWSALAKKTVVVTTTLNGRMSTLDMETGNQGLTTCLANADAFIPKAPEEYENIGDFFASQQPSNQKGILDYFTPKGRSPKKKSKRMRDKSADINQGGSIETITIEDSGGEQNTSIAEFQDRKSKRKRKKRKISDFSPLNPSKEIDQGREEIVLCDSDAEDNAETVESPSKVCDTETAGGIENETHKISIESEDVQTLPNTSTGTELAAVEQELDSRWSCGACTFLNFQGLRFCEICSSPKPKPKRQSKRKKVSTSMDSDTDIGSVSFGYEESAKKRKHAHQKLKLSAKSNEGFSEEGDNEISKLSESDAIDSNLQAKKDPVVRTPPRLALDSQNETCKLNQSLNTSKRHGKVHDISDSEEEMESVADNKVKPCDMDQTGHASSLENTSAMSRDSIPAGLEMKDSGEVISGKWKCEACTFLNLLSLPFCEMCSTPKPKLKLRKPDSVVVESDTDFGNVSFENEERAEKGICETALSHEDSFCRDLSSAKKESKSQSVAVMNCNNTEKSAQCVKKKKKPSCLISNPDDEDGDSASDLEKHESTESVKLNGNNFDRTDEAITEKKCRISLFENDTDMDTIRQFESEDAERSDCQEDAIRKGGDVVIPESDEEMEREHVIESGKIKCISSSDTESLSLSQSKKTPKTFRFKKMNSVCGTPRSIPGTPDSSVHTPGNSQDLTPNDSVEPSVVKRQKWPSSQPDSSSSQRNNTSSMHSPLRPIPFSPARIKMNIPSCSITRNPEKSPPVLLNESTTSDEKVILKETAAAFLVFSPKKKKPGVELYPWRCPTCDLVNDAENDDCDGCLEGRPTEDVPQDTTNTDTAAHEPEKRTVDLDRVPMYNMFKFCCSKNTSRIYLYDEDGAALHSNFTVLDIELDNMAVLPDFLLHPHNLRHIRRFVREWKTLGPTKRRVIIRSGAVFTSPLMIYDHLRSNTYTKQRYMTKEDVATSAQEKAEAVGGSVRVINRPPVPRKRKKGQEEQDQSKEQSGVMKSLNGMAQALDAEGRPMCVLCHKVYSNELVSVDTVKENPWQTRFCSKPCMEQFWMQSHRSYGTERVFEEEHGVCQLCGFDVHHLFTQIKVTKDLAKRATLIKESKFNVLKPEIKEKMVKKPNKGLFWQVDHIRPVVEGGGMCDIDNLRTLCTLCHRDVTSQQHRDRAKRRRLQRAATSGDITAFFKRA